MIVTRLQLSNRILLLFYRQLALVLSRYATRNLRGVLVEHNLAHQIENRKLLLRLRRMMPVQKIWMPKLTLRHIAAVNRPRVPPASKEASNRAGFR